MIKTNISIIKFYEYMRNIGRTLMDIFEKYWEIENHIKIIEILQKSFKMIKISKIHILELFNITKLNLYLLN